MSKNEEIKMANKKLGRNEICPCNSGKKYKKCCFGQLQSVQSTAKKEKCGLCGSSKKKLTKTPCCDNWICDGEDDYVVFSYARNSCYRNHDHYTICSHHHQKKHKGRWQDCMACKEECELPEYVEFGTNEYNFEALQNPDRVTVTCFNCGFTANSLEKFALQTSTGRYCVKEECIEAGWKIK